MKRGFCETFCEIRGRAWEMELPGERLRSEIMFLGIGLV